MKKFLSFLASLSFLLLSGCIDPTVQSISPQDGETGVSISTTAFVVFNSPIDSSTLDSNAFQLEESVTGTTVAGSLVYTSNDDVYTVTFTPSSALSNSTQYTVISTGKLLKENGKAISAAKWSFTTAAASATTVTPTTPTSGATGVLVGTTITATLSAALDESTLSSSSFQLQKSSTSVAGTLTYDSDNLVITLTPASSLDSEATYTVTTTNTLLDTNGQSVSAATWSFTTENTTTTIKSLSPENSKSGVLTNTKVTANLSGKLDSSTLDENSFSVEVSSTGTDVDGTLVYDSDDLTITFTPNSSLATKTKYTVASTSALLDANGNSVTSASSSFTTEDYIVRLSKSASGTEGNAGANATPFLNDDGQYALFTSASTNLVSTDANGNDDIFRVDNSNNTIKKVVVSSTVETNESLKQGTPDNNGNLVVFHSIANNLVDSDSNGANDVFSYNWSTGAIARLSIHSDGTQANANSDFHSVSGDGLFVAYHSSASNLIDGDGNGVEDVFLYKISTKTATRVSIANDETEANAASSNTSGVHPFISDDGRYITFPSSATNLITGDSNGVIDVFLRDTSSETTTRISVKSDGTQTTGQSDQPVMSSDGRYIAFRSSATDLIGSDTNGVDDIFLHDTTDNETERVSIRADKSASNGASSIPGISADGRFISFVSSATNLVSNDDNGVADVFVYDTKNDKVAIVSISSSSVQGNAAASSPSISANGRYIVFLSASSNLVSSDNNSATDAFRVVNPLN